jgi:hypothetical protein
LLRFFYRPKQSHTQGIGAPRLDGCVHVGRPFETVAHRASYFAVQYTGGQRLIGMLGSDGSRLRHRTAHNSDTTSDSVARSAAGESAAVASSVCRYVASVCPSVSYSHSFPPPSPSPCHPVFLALGLEYTAAAAGAPAGTE